MAETFFGNLFALPIVNTTEMATDAPRADLEVPAGVRIAGGYGKRRSAASIVPYGHASAGKCERVYSTALGIWGIDGTNSEERNDFLFTLAEVLMYGTSGEIEWKKVTFVFDGETFDMAPLADSASREIDGPNPVRVWTRDFRKGEIPFRIHEVLANPENIAIRQLMAANYETTVSNAQFCFDTSDALISSGMTLSQADILLIKRLAAFTIGRAQQNGYANGDLTASSNHAGTVGGTKQPNTPSTAPAASIATSEQRGGFRSLRG